MHTHQAASQINTTPGTKGTHEAHATLLCSTPRRFAHSRSLANRARCRRHPHRHTRRCRRRLDQMVKYQVSARR